MGEQSQESARRLRLSVERGDAGESIRGVLERSDGESVPFSGWLGLISTIEDAVLPPARPANVRELPDDGDPVGEARFELK